MSHLKPNIFISYSRHDEEFVDRLRADLERAEIDVWIDRQGLKVGTDNWEQAIRDALRNAHAVIYVASPDAPKSRYVLGELAIADMYQCKVFPLWASGEKWVDCAPLELIGVHYGDARGDNYVIALTALLGAIADETKLLPKRARPHTEYTLPKDFEPRNPYKSLRAFRFEDRNEFFGRDRLTNELIEALKTTLSRNNERFLAVVGPSGSGKSSVIMAGLIPRLKEGALSGSERWIYLTPVLPGPRPLEELAATLSRALNTSITSVQDDLEAGSRAIHLRSLQLVQERQQKVVLFVDQFEELFTQTLEKDTRDRFVDLLVTAATESNGQVLVIVTLRADFYDRPMNYQILGKLMETNSKSILPMTLDELRQAIESPAKLPASSLQFEEGLGSVDI